MEAITGILVLIMMGIAWAIKHGQEQQKQAEFRENTNTLYQEMVEMTKPMLVVIQQLKPGLIRLDRTIATSRGTILNAREHLIMDMPVLLQRSIKTGTEWKSGSRGVSLAVAKGVRVRVGGSRGNTQATYEQQQDVGHLSLTTQRIIYTGRDYSFSLKLAQINNMTRDGASLFVDAKSRDVPDFYATFANDTLAGLFAQLYSDPDATYNIQAA